MTNVYACNICGRFPADRAHIKSKGAGGSMDAENIMHLCRMHHIESHRIGIVTFVKRYPQVERLLSLKGWSVVDELGQQKLRKTKGSK